jgi:Transposase IS66 family
MPPTICRSIGKARSTPAKASSSIARLAERSVTQPPSPTLHERLLEHLKGSPKLFMDRTGRRCSTLRAGGPGPAASGRSRATTGPGRIPIRPPWYLYAPGRGVEHAIRPLAGFSGVLQVDAYAVYGAGRSLAPAGR